MEPTRTATEIRTHWRSILLLFLLLWFLLASAYRSALAPSPGITGIDFQIYYDAATRLMHGEPLYIFRPAGDTYVYPPLLALLLRPLAALNYQDALRLWFFLAALCLGGSVILYSFAARFGWRDLALVGVTLIIGFRFWPTTMNFSLGQVNFLLLLLICGMFLADSYRMLKSVAALIVTAALVKTWMIGLLLYLILRGRSRMAALSLCAYATLLAASFAAVGWDEWHTFWKLTAGYADQSVGQIAATQSITGFAGLHFGVNHHISPLLLSPSVSRFFILAGFSLMLGGFLYIARQAPRQPSHEARLQLGLVILSLLLMLPMCQSEYFVFCLPLLWTLIAPAAAQDRILSWPVIVGSLAVYLVFTRAWPCAPPIPEAYRHGAMSLLVSTNFFAAFALWFLALYALRCARMKQPVSQQYSPSML